MKGRKQIKKISLIFALFVLYFILSAYVTTASQNQDSLTISFLPINLPPFKPINPDPADGAINVGLPVNLSVDVFDPTGDILDVYFYNGLNDDLIGVDYNVASKWSTATVVWNSVQLGGTYYWYAVADDRVFTNKSDTWSFKTKPAPPSGGGGGGYLPPANIPPLANITGPNIAYKYENLIFSAYNSIDLDGTIVGYRWDFENDGIYDTAWLEDYIIEHNFSKIGNYTILLQVRDNYDAMSTAYHNITIIDLGPSLKLPVANVNGPYFGYVNEDISFTGNGSYDPDGFIIIYYWDFGDGNNSYLKNPSHTYEKPGKYTVILRVTDNDYLTNLSSTKVLIIQKEEKLKERELPLLLPLLVTIIMISILLILIILKRKELRNSKERIQKLEKKMTRSIQKNKEYDISNKSEPKDSDINKIVDEILENKN